MKTMITRNNVPRHNGTRMCLSEADRGNFGPLLRGTLLRGMEHWSEACWSEAWGFGPRLGAEMAHGIGSE